MILSSTHISSQGLGRPEEQVFRHIPKCAEQRGWAPDLRITRQTPIREATAPLVTIWYRVEYNLDKSHYLSGNDDIATLQSNATSLDDKGKKNEKEISDRKWKKYHFNLFLNQTFHGGMLLGEVFYSCV